MGNHVFQKSTQRVVGIWVLLSYIVTFTTITSIFFPRDRDFSFFSIFWQHLNISTFAKPYAQCHGLNKSCFHPRSYWGVCVIWKSTSIRLELCMFPQGVPSRRYLARTRDLQARERLHLFLTVPSDFSQIVWDINRIADFGLRKPVNVWHYLFTDSLTAINSNYSPSHFDFSRIKDEHKCWHISSSWIYFWCLNEIFLMSLLIVPLLSSQVWE